MRILLIAFLFFPLLCVGNHQAPMADGPVRLQYFFEAYSMGDGNTPQNQEFQSFITKLEERQSSFKDVRSFISFVFDKTHRRFLRSYTNYVSFGKTMDTGVYNCLTGTALYALLLDNFNIDYQIIETNYHIFILAHTEKGDVLIEATDPENGCVTDTKNIEARIARYKQNEVADRNDGKRNYQYSTDLYKEVSLDEMTGLLYYNLAIVSYNKKELSNAVEQLQQAIAHYQSPRTEEFSRLLLLTVVDSELEEHLKERCIKDLQSMRRTNVNLTARVGL
ncbi:MAG: hypothetical protein ABJA70_17135 [Chryseolinea sp.]